MSKGITWLAAVAIGTTSVPNDAAAADWRVLISGTSGSVVFVDVGSLRELPAIPIQRPFPVRQLWVKIDFSEDKSVTYREIVQKFYFNCSAETGMSASQTIYNANGGIVRSSSQRDYDFRYEPETPDSIGYALMEFACGRRSVP